MTNLVWGLVLIGLVLLFLFRFARDKDGYYSTYKRIVVGILGINNHKGLARIVGLVLLAWGVIKLLLN